MAITLGSIRERALRSPQGRQVPPTAGRASSLRTTVTRLMRWVVVGVFSANLAVIFELWLHAGGIAEVTNLGTLLTSAGQITGLLGAYLLLVQILLLVRIPALERTVGFDRLTGWHRRNGKLSLSLILAHVGLITAGYALTGRMSIPQQFLSFLQIYPGMIAATAATGLLLLVVVTSIAMVRRRSRYEIWFVVHLMSYGAVALAWFHQLPTGTAFIGNPVASAYWIAVYVVSMELIFMFRVVQPLIRGFWHRLRVAEVVEEGPGVVSLRITGHHLDWMNARSGQFFLWRFLTKRHWSQAHPFSLSAAPDGKSLRITVKSLGDYSADMANIVPGTRVMTEGPFGHFTDEARSRSHVLLVAGGVGITPIRALLEEMVGDLVLVYRVTNEEEIIFRTELEELARERGVKLRYVVGSRDAGGRNLLSAHHLRELVPDIQSREVYVCGPPSLSKVVERSTRRAGVPSKHIHIDRFAF